MVYMLVHHNCNFISLFHIVVKIRLFDKKKAVVDGVAEKDPCKRFRNNTLYAQCFNDLRCLLSGGTAAEVLSCYNNVTFLDLSCQLRAKGTESVLFHIVNGFQRQILGRNDDIGVNIIAQYPHFSCKCFHMYILLFIPEYLF